MQLFKRKCMYKITTLIMSNKEMEDFMNIGGFVGPILGTVATSLFGNVLANKEVKAMEEE